MSPSRKQHRLKTKNARGPLKCVRTPVSFGEDSNAPSVGQRLMQQLQSLDVEVKCEDCHTRQVSIGTGHGADEPTCNQVVGEHHNRYAAGCALCSTAGSLALKHDGIKLDNLNFSGSWRTHQG